MSTSTVDVWIDDWADPCKISNQTWHVTVTDCENRVIRWCDMTYEGIEARCGHIELQLPPGCYLVFAVLRIPLPPPPPPPPSPPDFPFPGFIQFFADPQVLTLGCGANACIRLHVRSYRRAWDDVMLTTQRLVRQGAIPQNVADQVAAAMEAALENGPPETNADAMLRDLRQRLLFP